MSRNTSLHSGQFVRNKKTGRFEVTGIDPYGICASGEFIIADAKASSDRWLGDAAPLRDWDVIPKGDVPSEVRAEFAHMVT